MKNKAIILQASITILLLLSLCGSFAWIINVAYTKSFVFTVAYIDSKVTVFTGIDNNNDGILEKDKNNNDMFIQLGDSYNGKIIGVNSDGTYIYDSGLNVNLSIEKMVPTQIFTWKLIVENYGDVNSIINSFLEVILPDNLYASGLDVLSLKINNNNKLYFANALNFNGENYEQKLNFIKDTEISFEGLNRVKEFVIKLEFETLDNLNKSVSNGGAGLKMSVKEYQDFQNKSFKMLMYIKLENSDKII